MPSEHQGWQPHNYRAMEFQTETGMAVVAGLAHPIRYNMGQDDQANKYYYPHAVLNFLQKQGFNTLISLDEPVYTMSDEYSDIEVIANIAKLSKLNHILVPFSDFAAPSLDMFRQVIDIVTYPDNGSVAIHCGAGAGRTGTMLAALALNEIVLDTRDRAPELLKDYNPSKDKTSIPCFQQKQGEEIGEMEETIAYVSYFVADAINTIRQNDQNIKYTSVETVEQIKALEYLEGYLLQNANNYLELNEEQLTEQGSYTKSPVRFSHSNSAISDENYIGSPSQSLSVEQQDDTEKSSYQKEQDQWRPR